MNSNEPTRTQGLTLKQGPKPTKFPCLVHLAVALMVLDLIFAGIAIGLVFR